ncbi:hypothetical protein [Blastopirellula marina]|uniref:Carboxypeptidase regulatory-like domain-containing protein n=1 Tax=Blastopirellula marina DSM 3645 TaxID=314230 RepID=A3ZY91_9BACT|nr:hypothetical protein [Blastopirellula marina]EAQ78567.1 hypothetical protein DSM3645_26829 [Blastopirellula marina DSM 3645]
MAYFLQSIRPVASGSALLLFCLISLGCGSQTEGPLRFRVSGDITFQGNPIPAGLITFSPDAALGNSGPQGVARIRDGHFDTGFDGGKGVLSGPQIVKVIGADGETYTDDAGIQAPEGKPLFAPWETKLEVLNEDIKIDWEVPQLPVR